MLYKKCKYKNEIKYTRVIWKSGIVRCIHLCQRRSYRNDTICNLCETVRNYIVNNDIFEHYTYVLCEKEKDLT
jgi:hypothetical protein